MITLKVYGETRCSTKENWQKVICFVSYCCFSKHRQIVENSFQDYLKLDLDDMRENHSELFLEPHNIGRAILLYHYFRERHRFFKDNHWEYENPESIPIREPDTEGEDYKLWVCEDEN
ncbi:MAG: hypothetical protein PHS66_02085 [Candidatus Omnitrophica bacterium]|nr:hypothetical protein [Candidatus Omnitrophota bacterium]